MKRKHSSPGMFTVEMAIIFPIIFLTLLGLMYIGIMLYQNVTTQAAAMRTASRVSYTWDSLGKANAWSFQSDPAGDGSITAFNYTQHDPYGSITGAIGTTTRTQNATAYFNWLLGKNPTLLGDNEETKDPKVTYHWGLLAPSVEVTVTKHYINPMGHLMEQIGIGAEETRQVTATASVTDPVEFIRLAGLIYDEANK